MPKVSLDGGETWQDAPKGVWVSYEDQPIPGEDENGGLHLHCTDEGIAIDVWCMDYNGDDYNIGASKETPQELIKRLVDENS